MTRGLRTTYVTGEIRGDTLLISRLSRFSPVVHDFSRRQRQKQEDEETAEGQGGGRERGRKEGEPGERARGGAKRTRCAHLDDGGVASRRANEEILYPHESS